MNPIWIFGVVALLLVLFRRVGLFAAVVLMVCGMFLAGTWVGSVLGWVYGFVAYSV